MVSNGLRIILPYLYLPITVNTEPCRLSQEIATPEPKHAWHQYDQNTCCTSKGGGSAEMENIGGSEWEYRINYSHRSLPP